MLNLSCLSLRSAQPLAGLQAFGQRFEKPLTGALLTLSLSLIASGVSLNAHSAEPPVLAAAAAASNSVAMLQARQHPSTLPSGVYLFGQSPESDQIGATYLVFEVDASRIVGAFYMPASSFDCFQGEVEAERLALNIVDSYDQSRYAYEVALAPSAAVAATPEGSIAPTQLQGYHQLDSLSAQDQTILATCRADYEASI